MSTALKSPLSVLPSAISRRGRAGTTGQFIRLLHILIYILSISGCEKYRLEEKMNELCRIDGGLTIYENIIWPPERFDKSGAAIPVLPNSSTPEKAYGEDYRNTSNRITLVHGDPVLGEGRLDRTEMKLIREVDGKILAKLILYSRMGGDFIYFGHFSTNRCPKGGNELSVSRVFVPGR